MENETLTFSTILTIIIGLATLWISSTRRKKQVPVPVSCPNPNCVRCIKYRQVQQHAVKRLAWVAKEVKQQFPKSSLDRVVASIQHPQLACSALQAPTVLMLADLPSQEVVTERHPEARRLLKSDAVHPEILREVETTTSLLWNINDSPTGSWEVLPLLNQGSLNPHMIQACPKLYDYVKNIPNLMDGCLFGNAMISKILPDTTIEPHCGPTNVRHRLQFALKIPRQRHNQQLSLHVGVDHQLEWKNVKDVFVFDDSFVHWVNYETNKNHGDSDDNGDSSSSGARLVLIVDLWHPDLTPAERMLIRYLYPPLPGVAS
jgi:aspartyl/asparaginyl beta-hydroxylase (cupin superfamily)